MVPRNKPAKGNQWSVLLFIMWRYISPQRDFREQDTPTSLSLFAAQIVSTCKTLHVIKWISQLNEFFFVSLVYCKWSGSEQQVRTSASAGKEAEAAEYPEWRVAAPDAAGGHAAQTSAETAWGDPLSFWFWRASTNINPRSCWKWQCITFTLRPSEFSNRLCHNFTESPTVNVILNFSHKSLTLTLFLCR